jgi:hypothetical protein
MAATAALVVSGLFEYNFGDSEVLALFLFFMAAPYAFQGRAIAGTPAGREIAGQESESQRMSPSAPVISHGQTGPERQTLSQP